MDLECDLSKIQSEELLRKMWQQSEDTNRKKEIRSQLYKLRESRLRDLYQFDIMSDNRVTGFGKDPLAPSHGESLADQSFQSLKSKEIRDSMSPTEMKFQSMALNNPSNTGWNVQSSSEVSPDGRGFRAETIATTDGVENINGGTAEFKGRNEQRSSAMHEGDDKNFLKKASESSNTHLQEKVVVGDENSGRTEIRTSSSTSTSSSKVFQSSSTTEYENGQPVDHHPQYLMDSNRAPQRMQQQPQQHPQRMYEPSQGMPEPQYQQRPSQYEPQYDSQQEVRRSTDAQQQEQYSQQTEQYNRNRHETNTSQNVQTNETHEQNKRYVDMDKASPEYQKHVQYLMSQPGEVISSTVEYPKPNVKMITTVKRLPDGTIVRNKRYETEDTTPTPTPAPTYSSNTRQTTSNTNTQRRDSQTHQQPKNYQGHPPSERLRRPNDDVVDNVETTRRHTHDDSVSNVETKYSTVKTSNRKFSTETTSETIQECDDGYQPSGAPGSSRPRPVTNDFSTQGFPSVRPNKPTQEFATDRPQSARPNQASPSQNMTSPRDALIPTRGEFQPTVTERRIPTEDGEVIIVSSEKKRSVKHHTNSERIIETDVRSTDDNRYQQISDVTTSTNTTHGFPSVKEPQAQQSNTFPDLSQLKPHADTPGYPANARPSGTSPAHAPAPNDDGVVVTSQKSHSTKYNTNTERIIETEILGDDGRPIARVPADVEYISNKYTVTTPGGDQVPQYVYPGATKPSPSRDYSTQGFPSVRSPTKGTPDYSTQGFPSARDTQPSVRSPTKGSPDYSTQGFPSARDGPRPNGTTERPQSSPVKAPTPVSTTKKPSSTIETTERVIMKEKEVDAAHRAFAASLRSSSPVDQTRRDSYSTDGPRHTPRSSVSSTKTFRRDVREGSHDSETSRVSSNTVTRQTPPRTVGGKTVVVTERITSSPRGTKSPSPGKTVTTTTTTRTVTSKTPVKDVPKSDNQHTTTTTNTTTTTPTVTLFPINHDSLTITKKTVSDNQSNNPMQLREVVEEPCIKKHYSLLGQSDHTATTVAQKQEPSPRSSPAPSSRSSPYPSKSKSPPGEDDQTVKTHTSRPLSPSFTSSRSPQPIGSKDVPNPTDQHPHAARPTTTNVVVAAHPFDSDDDERRTVDREATFEQIDKTTTTTRRKPSRENTPTSTNLRIEDDVFITDDDYLQEDVDATTQSVKTKTKQLIRHEKEPVPSSRGPKPGMVRTTKASPQETQRIQIEVTKRTDRSEEIKRPKQQDHTSPSAVKQQPLGPKTSPKTQHSPKGTPTPTQTPRKSLTQLHPKTAPKNTMTKPTDGSPDRGYPYETDIPSKPTSKSQPGPQTKTSDTPEKKAPIPRSGYPAVVETIISKSTQKPIKPQPLPQSQPRKSAEAPNIPRRGSPERKYPQSTPIKSTETPRRQQPQTPQRSNDIPKNKIQTPYIPRSGSPPDGEYPSEEEPTTVKSTQKPIKPESQPRGSVARPYIPRSGSPDGEYPSEEEQTTTKSTQKPIKPRGSVERPYIPRSDSPEFEYPSENDDESITENIRETSEITIQTSNKNVKNTQKQIDVLIKDGYTVVDDQVTRAKLRPQQPGTDKPTDKEPKTSTRSPLQQPKFEEPIPRDTKEPTSYSPKTSRPNLYETTAQKLIRNDETEYITQKNITTDIHEKFMDAERTQPQAAKTIAPQKEPKVIGYPDEEEPSSRFPQQQHPKTSEPLQKEPKSTDYPHDKEPSSRYPQQQPKLSEPIQKEPKSTGYPDEKEPYFRSPQQKPRDCYESPQGEPKTTDDSEPASKFPKQHPGDRYEPSQKEPRPTGYPDDKKPKPSPTKITETTNKTTINEQFMEAERTHPERPDGAFISKSPEEPSPYPTYAKKGAGRRDTFEDRCRQILGMENYGDTPGAYKNHPLSEIDILEEEQKNIQTKREETQRTTIEVKIEDCDDDDEPLSINSVKKNLVITKTPKSDDDMPQKPKPNTVTTTKDTAYVSKKRTPDTASDSEPEAPHPTEPDYETIDVTMKRTEETDINVTKSHTSKSPTRPVEPTYEPTKRQPIKTESTPKPTTRKSPEEPQRDKPKMGEKYVTTTTEEVYISGVKKDMPDTMSDSEPETLRATETSIDAIKKPTSRSPTRSVSPTYGSPTVTSYETIEVTNVAKKPSSRSPTRSVKPQDKDDIPRTVEPTPESSKRLPSKVDSTQKPTAKKPHDRVPSDDITKKGKEPMRKKPNVNEEFISTEKVYVTKVNKESPDTESESDTEPETVDTKETTYETIEVTNKRTEKSNIDITMKQTSRSPTRSVSPTYDTIEVTNVTKKPTKSNESPRRQPTTTAKKPQDKEPYDDIPRKGNEPLKMKPKTNEEVITTEKVYVTKVKKDLPDTTSESEPEQCLTKETTQQTIEVTKKRTEKSDIDITKKQTSRSPTRSVSPTYGSPKVTSYETIKVTNVTKKPSSRSPTRPMEPTSESPKRQSTRVDSTQKPTSRKPQDKEPSHDIPRKDKEPLKKKPNMNEQFITTEKVYVTKNKKDSPDTASDSEPETCDTKEISYKTIEETRESTEKSNIDIIKKQTSRSPTRSVSPTYGSPKVTSYETIEVNNVSRKPSSRSPTRPMEPTSQSPKRQPTKSDSSQKPTAKKPQDKEPSDDISRKGKEPLKKKPNMNEEYTSTGSVYVTKIKKELPDTPSDSEPETLDTRETSYQTTEVANNRHEKSSIDITKKQTSKSPVRSKSPTKVTSYETIVVGNVTKKPSSKSPTRSVSPTYGTLKETSNETIEVTKKRVDKSQIDVTKKPSSRSPTRSVEPTKESPKRQPTKSDATKKPITKKPEVKEPLKKNPNANETFITTEKVYVTKVNKDLPDTTSDSEPEELETSYETIEVTNRRVDKSQIDIMKKTTSRSPTRSVPELPKRQPIKKTQDKEPYGITPQKGKEPLTKKKPNVNEEFITTEKVHITGVKKGMTAVTTTDSETEQITHETLEVTRKISDKDIDTTKKPATRTPTKSSPISEMPKRTPTKTTTSQKQTVKNDKVTETTSIKDRLRPSTRKEKSPKKPDQVDAGSSPDSSPTRHTTERRRSSNISVNTEIIIEHTESESVGTKNPGGSPRKPNDSVFKEIIDSTTLPDKLPRKMPVTERKESAPVHRVTRKDKDSKMSRSTSENLIKVTKKPETTPTTLTPPSPKMSPKPSADHRRPNKCFATKTINLSTTDRLMTSEDMENVIIDIQHAKSSREPSPDKIVPTPVPAHFDTGKPRYPDVVQEPEDEPRKKPVIKNIPIFEEEHNTYVGCHITEVNRKTFDREDDLFSTPLVEAPPSLDYPTSDKSYPTTVISDDECLLSVHDKVTKFQHIAEEVKKPKTSSPFHREYDDTTRVPDNDECLLTVDEKVDRFIKTAENLTNQPITPTPTRDTRRPPFIDETDEDLETTECPFTTVKLAPSEPQRSPELVRHISRHISRQSDVGEPTERPEPTKHTHETHEEYVSNRTTTAQEFVTHQQTSAVKQRPLQPVDHDDDRNDNDDYNNDGVDDDDDRVVYVDDDVADDDDDHNEELIPHTATHTIRLEERRQKDILTRPSVFDNNSSRVSKKQPTGVGRVNKTQPKYVSPTPKDSEKSSNQTRQRQPTQQSPSPSQPQTRPQVKSRAKPEIPKQTPKVAATVTTTTTTTTSSTGKRQPQSQSPQQRRVPHPDTDCDYRGGGSNVVETKTSVISSTTNKQTTKPYSINGPKKSPQPVSVPTKKRPEKQSPSHSPLHINKTKNLKHDDVDYEEVDYEEFEVEVVPNDSETELIINSDTARRSTTTKTKATTNKTTTATGKTSTSTNVQQPHSTTSPTARKMKEIPPGSTSPSSSSSSPPSPNKSTRAHPVVNLTERNTLLKHNTTTKSSETNESFLENRPPTKKTPASTPYPHHKTKPAITTTDSVAARRSLFENHNSPKPLGKRPTPTSSPSTGRRPSYMDHTKSSLEHIRRDSLEVNKTNYSRRPSGDDYDEGHLGTDRNTQVKFDVPQKLRQEVLNVESEEDINIEEIFELVILERLLETVTSYELRRRIRAQIRLVKKNLNNVERNEQTIKTNVPERVNSPDSKTKTTTASQVNTTTKKQQQYYYKEKHEEEELRTTSSSHTSPDRSQTLKVTKVSRTQSPESRNTSSVPSERSLSPQQRPSSQTRVCSRPHDRSPSPTSKVERKEFSLKETTKKQYIEDVEQVDHMEKIYKESSPRPRRPKQYYPIEDDEEVQQVIRIEKIRKESSPMARRPKQDLPEHESEIEDERNTRRPSRKSESPRSSPERQQVERQTKTYPRSGSPNEKKPTQPRVCSKSPENKAVRETTNGRMEQTVTTMKQQHKRAPAPSAPKTKPETKTPVWADRKNVLKTPSATSPTTVRKPISVSDSRTSSSLSRTVKSSTNQKHSTTSSTTNKSSYVEDDCITSSYGIGPTDENGLPLFGIRALKKKKPSAEPCETTEEVTGYVVEEKYYSDNKSKPIVERKELVYSTNPEELKAIKEKVKDTTVVKSIKSDRLGYDEEDLQSNNATYKTKTTTSVRSSPEEFLESSTTKYVRRGSVKEMSEKFIQKESTSSVTEKTNNYPKAGLILRTNSRKQSRDNNDNLEGENIEYCESRTTVHRDSEEDDDYQVGVSGSDHFIVESESETESMKKTQREFKKVTSTKSSSSRSFLNTKGEQKLVTSVDDVLDRMRNADNVVEAGDTAEDQEARALLNKFLGASIIMKGVESTIPINRETKIITTTTTGSGKQPAKHEVTTTRVTKSIKSGSSSSPVTETTCDIEEIWDEEILKQLLEQAKTYEERRKIRSRLRELMADRAEKNSCQQTGKEEGEPTTAAAGTSVEEKSTVQRSDSSASEYEEIIEIIEEEVTDDSSDSGEVEETISKTTTVKESDPPTEVTEEKKNSSPPPDVIPEKQSAQEAPQTDKSEEVPSPVTSEPKPKEETVTETTKQANDLTDSSAEQGESAMPTQQGSMHQQKMMQANQATNQKLGTNNSSTFSKTTTATSKTSSDRSMHAPPNNKSSSSSSAAQSYGVAASQQNPPIVTVTAGRTNNNNTLVGRDVGNSLDIGSSSSQRQVDRLGVPHKEDSGTESGEDLRFIAAGLRDQLQMKSDSNIIDDVTCALSRLETSLKEGKDITVDTEKRKALLALVGRLQVGLTSPEKLAEIAAAMSELDGNDGLYGETSSPEADAHRSGRQRFAKRRNRIDRHTVGVSREELADARRYMEDMLIMDNISQSTTPDAVANHNSPPQWYPIEKNASTGAILTQQSIKQNNFLNENDVQNTVQNTLSPNNTGKRRPVSGDFSVSFGLPSTPNDEQNVRSLQLTVDNNTTFVDKRNAENASPDSTSKFSRFSNKKQLMKRANTIDISKTKRFNSDLDTDSEAEDKSQLIGLKRAVHPTVKKRVQNVVPPFEPKTENDRKFLAFINKQSDKPGLGWTSSRSVSNWTSKFGSLKHTFEAGGSTVSAAKPPQVPSHIHPKPQQSYKQPPVQRETNYISTNQQIAQRLQQEAQRQAEERRIRLEYERMEAERREREKQEILRHQQQRERLEKERLEREYYEREIRDRNQRAAAAQHNAVSVPKPIPINEFKHAPQSVFRPIDNGDSQPKGIYKPIPQLPIGNHSWQAPTTAARAHPLSPNTYSHARPDNSFITSPPASSKSPIGLPWASKPTVDSSSFKQKANKFEERSRYDNYNNGPMLQRHNSLRASNVNVAQNDDYKKRPSLPNTTDPYSAHRDYQEYQPNPPLAYAPPPPTNVSFIYSNRTSKPTYLSYPCLPTAVSDSDKYRSREDSLTNPEAVPLVLTSSNPSYCPPQQMQNQQYTSQDHIQPFDLMSPPDSALTSPSIQTMQQQTDCTDDDLDSDNLMEYRAVSKVMAKPQSQTAVTVGRRTGHVSDDEVYGKNSTAAKSLLSTMKNIGSNATRDNKRQARSTKRPEAVTSPQGCLSPDGRSYQAPIVEPLFPDVTKFEPNRQPMYDASQKKQQATPTPYNQNTSYGQQPRKQPTMYKSLENIAKRIPPSPPAHQINSMYTPQQPSPTPYVSETQTSYVVTYPLDDTTDDEDQSRYSSFSQQNVSTATDTAPLRRSRNTSETSTVSSTTTSMAYANNLPSANTSWTSNPIIADEPMKPVSQGYYEPPQHYTSLQSIPQSSTSRTEDLHIMSPKSNNQYQYNQPTSPGKYTNTMPTPYSESKYKSQSTQSHKVPQQPTPVAAATTNYTSTPQYNANVSQASSYEGAMSQQTNHYEASRPTQSLSQVPVMEQQKPIAPQTQTLPTQTSAPKKPVASVGQTKQQQKSTEHKPVPKAVASTQPQQSSTNKAKKSSATTAVKSQEKATNKTLLATMRKTVSEDYKDVKTISAVREEKTSVMKEAATTKVVEQKNERIITDARRKSLGSALEYQKMAIESQQTEAMYKSSAPSDTPDIVKSSLPKDENQPILKKFGPPQRHHYMPNAYQNPMGKTDKTPESPTSAHMKTVEVTTTKSILKTSQQTSGGCVKPTVVESPATPQPDDDYIPRNIVFNNVHAFTSLSARRPDENRSHFEPVVRTNKLSKSDSWNQILNLQNQHAPAATHKFGPPPINELRRTKSGHTLSIPKMYEARVDKTEVTEKQKTVAAYFSGNKSPSFQEQTVVEQQTKRSAINRTKTSEKISASRKSLGSHVPASQGGLTRSATMPHIANLSLLDESNVEDAFEQLMMGS